MSNHETTYRIERTHDGVIATRCEGTEERPLPPRNDLFNHSPDGFEYGYAGSGPAQLALALLADATGDDEMAVWLHQDFKFEHITGRRGQSFEMTRTEILEWVRRQGGRER